MRKLRVLYLPVKTKLYYIESLEINEITEITVWPTTYQEELIGATLFRRRERTGIPIMKFTIDCQLNPKSLKALITNKIGESLKVKILNLLKII